MSSRAGKIVTFYSYKGGTGRTMAVANVAWILAMNGKKVLTVDWDLESPGLHKYFHPFLDTDTVASTEGVIEMITDYALAAVGQNRPEAELLAAHVRVLSHAVSLDWEFPDGGTLDLMTAGRQNPNYSSLISTMDWDNFYSRLGGGRFFDALGADMRRHYDYVLLDSRTGWSDIADICTVHLPDVLVDCFTLSGQSIEGAASVARQIDEHWAERGIRILPVPMRIEYGENAKVEVGRAEARAKFDRFPRGMSAEEANQYWLDVEIPYRPLYAFEETLAAFEEPAGSPNSILAAFERLTSAITLGEITSSPLVDDQHRLAVLARFARHGPVEPSTVLLSYLSESRPWADWIALVLGRAGLHVLLHCADGSSSAEDLVEKIDTATRAMVVLSPGYTQSERGERTWDDLVKAATSGFHQRLIALRISEARLASSFAAIAPLDLSGLDERQAREALLKAVDRPGQPSPGSTESPGPRYPGGLPEVPRVWNVGPRNAAFTGREAALERLRDQLLSGAPQALHGLGGVGKTQLALEYAHRFKSDYDVVWWVSVGVQDVANTELAELTRKLGILVGDNVHEAAMAAREALRRGIPYSRWLIIFDNADSVSELEGDLPGGNGHVLITTRNQAWSRLATLLDVDVFTSEESVAHLTRKVENITEDQALQVGTALGFLPLAVDQAAAWLANTGIPAGDYLDLLESQTEKALELAPRDFPTVVAKTWTLSFERLKKSSPAAIRMLELCAFFSPAPISMKMIYSDEMARLLTEYDDSLRQKQMLSKVVQELSRYALVRVNHSNKTMQVHRLVQALVRGQMTEGEREVARHDVHQILTGARPRQDDTDLVTENPENWPAFDQILPHVQPSRAAECVEDDTRQLLVDLVRYLWRRGDYARALSVGSSVAVHWGAKFGPDDGQLLYLRSQMNNARRALGRFNDAYTDDQTVYDRQCELEHIGQDHPHTLMTAAGLGADLHGLGRFQEALDLNLQTYTKQKSMFGEDYPLALAAANNVAVSYRLLGKCHSALEIDRDTLARRRAVLIPNHPFTLFSAENYGRDLRDAGRYRESADLLRSTRETYADVLGPEAIDTLRCTKSLAVSLHKLGFYQEAKDMMDRTLQSYITYFANSPERPSTALALATSLAALGNVREAMRITRDILDAQQPDLGWDHPYTLVTAVNLVAFQRVAGDPVGALALGEQTLAALWGRLGDEHPYSLACGVNVANCLSDLGRTTEAERLERQTLLHLREVLREKHPDTLTCQLNLSITLRRLGRSEESEQLRSPAVSSLAELLGAQHPLVTAVNTGRRTNRDIEFQPV